MLVELFASSVSACVMLGDEIELVSTLTCKELLVFTIDTN